MDSTDRALIREYERLRSDPRKVARRGAILAGTTYTRPVRSWCLTLRADDKRLETLAAARTVRYHDWGDAQPLCAVVEFLLSAECVRALCAPVVIRWPGVSIDAATEKFGVNRTTIHRWAKKGRVRLEIDAPSDQAFVHRAPKRVWTPSPVDPAGEVWSGPWGSAVRDLTRFVPDGWSQCVKRTHRLLRAGVFVRQFACPQCGRWSSKLLWAQRIWTVAQMLGGGTSADAAESVGRGMEGKGVRDGFLCWRCARVVYESAERSSRPGPGRFVDAQDRFVKRAVGVVGARGCGGSAAEAAAPGGIDQDLSDQ